MLGSSRLTAYHIFAISLFNFLILRLLSSVTTSEREVVDSKPHHHEKNMLQQKPKKDFS